MYPERELTRLAAHKATLQRDITLRRAQCADAAARVAQPLEWLDGMLAFWRRLSPLVQFAAVPLGILVQRTVSPRRKILRLLEILRLLVRWVRSFSTSCAGSAPRSDSAPGTPGLPTVRGPVLPSQPGRRRTD